MLCEAGGWSSVLERLLSMSEALDLIPSTANQAFLLGWALSPLLGTPWQGSYLENPEAGVGRQGLVFILLYPTVKLLTFSNP